MRNFFNLFLSAIISILVITGVAYAAYSSHSFEKDGVYAYVSTPAATTTTTGAVYYRLEGIFTNEILENWVLAGDPLSITYDGASTRYFEIEVHANLTSDTNGTTSTIAIYKNGVLQPNSLMDIYMKTLGESYTVSLNDVLAIENGDYIEIYIKSDKAGAEITANTLTTSAQTFFY